jgi:rhodanese-related sulfurtransferase
MSSSLSRHERTRDADPRSVPTPVPDEADLTVVDTTWGKIQPLVPFAGVVTVGELELADLVRQGAALIDTRVGGSRGGVTLPAAVHLPHDQIAHRRAELESGRVSILFCNGPQCPQTPEAIGTLLDAGHPAASLAYYRGGLHDWVTLGFPTEPV